MVQTVTLAGVEEIWFCADCEQAVDEPVPVYECSNCGNIFNRDESNNGNHQCPECNKFASKLHDHGCPDCNESVEEVWGMECPEGEFVIVEDFESYEAKTRPVRR